MHTLKRLHQVFIKRMIFSSTQSEQCMIMTINYEFSTSAFSRLGDEVWTAIESLVDFYNVIYLNGQFYVVDGRGKLFTYHISNLEPKKILFAEPEENVYIDDKHFFFILYKSMGKLFLVYRDIIHFYYDFNFENLECTMVKNFDNRSLFQGNNNFFFIFSHPPFFSYFLCYYFV
ncbi:hypothetical protein NE237_008923 [Protea cynaroides]|uniref:KIB1-4 beta-propeller domain-containing protein n=1 Tax=Protea cynaroides TaxID=273540 RepID=A0A9Q0KWG1_9MAGN|nr:hypothetical protein NE237_008923 [Protea cynaroides]